MTQSKWLSHGILKLFLQFFWVPNLCSMDFPAFSRLNLTIALLWWAKFNECKWMLQAWFHSPYPQWLQQPWVGHQKPWEVDPKLTLGSDVQARNLSWPEITSQTLGLILEWTLQAWFDSWMIHVGLIWLPKYPRHWPQTTLGSWYSGQVRSRGLSWLKMSSRGLGQFRLGQFRLTGSWVILG